MEKNQPVRYIIENFKKNSIDKDDKKLTDKIHKSLVFKSRDNLVLTSEKYSKIIEKYPNITKNECIKLLTELMIDLLVITKLFSIDVNQIFNNALNELRKSNSLKI